MKIVQTPVRLFAAGGVESYVLNLSRELAEMGHDVKVICAGSRKERGREGRVSVRTLWTAGKIANTNITPALPLALLRESFDIMHTHLPTPWSADWSSLVAWLKERPLVLTYHSDILGTGLAEHVARAYNGTALKLLLKRADRIIVTRPGHISPHLSGHIEKVRTVPIGVDTEVFRPLNADRAGDILFLSVLDRYHDFKRLDVLLRAVRIAKRARPEIRLVVGGSGDLVDRYRALASSLGIAENVDFVGYVPAQRLVFYYNSCRLFALPSTDPSRETFGIVVLEALACGLPVVATEIAGAAKEIQETGAGIIVRPCDEGALASAVLSILENEDLASRMGKAGRRLALEKYAWRTVSRRIEQVYRELV